MAGGCGTLECTIRKHTVPYATLGCVKRFRRRVAHWRPRSRLIVALCARVGRGAAMSVPIAVRGKGAAVEPPCRFLAAVRFQLRGGRARLWDLGASGPQAVECGPMKPVTDGLGDIPWIPSSTPRVARSRARVCGASLERRAVARVAGPPNAGLERPGPRSRGRRLSAGEDAILPHSVCLRYD